MYCPECSGKLQNKDKNLVCKNTETIFPVAVSELINQAINDHKENSKSALINAGSIQSDWHCLSCSNKMYYSNKKLKCSDCGFTIKNILQHHMLNRVSHE